MNIEEDLFVAYFVIVHEDIWFEFESDVIKKKETSYGLQGQMFISNNRESAYNLAQSMIDGMGDINHDGKGDLFKMYSIGINHLERVSYFCNNKIRDQLSDLYGVNCGYIDIKSSFNEKLLPEVKSKDELLGWYKPPHT